MEAGDIVEQGTHDQLLESGGAYARLYRSQFEGASIDIDAEEEAQAEEEIPADEEGPASTGPIPRGRLGRMDRGVLVVGQAARDLVLAPEAGPAPRGGSVGHPRRA